MFVTGYALFYFSFREDWKPVLTINSIIYGLQFLFLVGLHMCIYIEEIQLEISFVIFIYGIKQLIILFTDIHILTCRVYVFLVTTVTSYICYTYNANFTSYPLSLYRNPTQKIHLTKVSIICNCLLVYIHTILYR